MLSSLFRKPEQPVHPSTALVIAPAPVKMTDAWLTIKEITDRGTLSSSVIQARVEGLGLRRRKRMTGAVSRPPFEYLIVDGDVAILFDGYTAALEQVEIRQAELARQRSLETPLATSAKPLYPITGFPTLHAGALALVVEGKRALSRAGDMVAYIDPDNRAAYVQSLQEEANEIIRQDRPAQSSLGL